MISLLLTSPWASCINQSFPNNLPLFIFLVFYTQFWTVTFMVQLEFFQLFSGVINSWTSSSVTVPPRQMIYHIYTSYECLGLVCLSPHNQQIWSHWVNTYRIVCKAYGIFFLHHLYLMLVEMLTSFLEFKNFKEFLQNNEIFYFFYCLSLLYML
jgi:hypothetical protein